jgi:ferredoxin
MIIFYFSGTGNSRYIAEIFAKNMECACHSIEEEIDFVELIKPAETVAFSYPIYMSRVPRIMREFVQKYKSELEEKKLVIFCTQQILSGDGARALSALLPKNRVIYAEHIFMSSNIFPVATNAERIKNKALKAERKMQKVCEDIKKGKVHKRGFSAGSRALGLIQAPLLSPAERRAESSVEATADCTNCGLCVSLCPMKNLAIKNEKITHKNNCTMCWRCVNKCPKKALIVGKTGKVKNQYKGIEL